MPPTHPLCGRRSPRFISRCVLHITLPYRSTNEDNEHVQLTALAEFITPDVSKLGECEFALISEMSSQLIVHHPYRTLSELQTELPLSSDEVALAWSVIND